MPGDAPTVRQGAILAYRLFDVAFEIDLPKAEAAWARNTRTTASRGRLTATPPQAMAFGVPPVQLVLDPIPLTLAGATLEAGVTARLYDFGVVSLALRVPVTDQPWSGFVALMDATEAATRDPAVWRDLLAVVRRGIGEALLRPSAQPVEEDYVIGIVRGFDEPLTAEALLQRVDFVPLLSGEQRPLSEGARRDLLQHRYSYYTDDLVVLAWNRAFILEPGTDTDVVDVLEVANAQLLEMRYYDELLDAELPRMYDLVEATHRGRTWLGARRYADLARRLYLLVAEVTELTEKTDNALQVIEDVYLARVYAAALDMFRVRTVSAAVDRKLSIIRDTYTALYDEASSRRAELMEIIIIVLISMEVVMGLMRH